MLIPANAYLPSGIRSLLAHSPSQAEAALFWCTGSSGIMGAKPRVDARRWPASPWFPDPNEPPLRHATSNHEVGQATEVGFPTGGRSPFPPSSIIDMKELHRLDVTSSFRRFLEPLSRRSRAQFHTERPGHPCLRSNFSTKRSCVHLSMPS